MIESNILGAAVGIQNQGVIDKTEGTSLPSTGDAVVAGKFKRGRMDKPFKVTSDNYKALLGYDPSNPSYLAVGDCFKQGVSELSVLRVGQTGGAGAGGGDGDTIDWDSLPIPSYVSILNKDGYNNGTYVYFSAEINGVLYNAEKLDLSNYENLSAELSNLISITTDSVGGIYISANVDNTELKVLLSPTEEQKVYSKDYIIDVYADNPTPQGVVLPNGDFVFRLYREASDW